MIWVRDRVGAGLADYIRDVKLVCRKHTDDRVDSAEALGHGGGDWACSGVFSLGRGGLYHGSDPCSGRGANAAGVATGLGRV